MNWALIRSSARRPPAWLGGLVALCLFPTARLAAQSSPATLPDLKLSASGLVRAIAVQDDGKIILGGSFVSVNDVARVNIARLNPNGSVDLTWSANLDNSGIVNAVAVVGTNIYAGGTMRVLDDPTRYGLVRLSGTDGSTDRSWGPTNNDPSLLVTCLAANANNVYVGGSFTNIGGVARSNLAMLSAGGSGSVAGNWNPGANQSVIKLILSSNDLFALGPFTVLGGQNRSNLAKIYADTGLVDTGWDAKALGGGIADMVLGATNLYVEGGFTNIGGVPRSGLAKLSALPPALVDTNWNSGGGLGGPIAFANNALFVARAEYVGAIFYFKQDAYGTGGLFTNWSAGFSSPPLPAYGSPTPLVLLGTSSALFAGGTFVWCDGSVSLSIAKLDLVSGARDPAFFANAQGPGTVYAAARQADGKVIIGGNFWFAGGVPRQNLARINPDGSLDRFWAPSASGPVYALAISDTDIFVGGNFFAINGTNRHLLAKLATYGSDALDPLWHPQLNGLENSLVYSLKLSGTNLIVGGNFLGGLGAFSTTGSGTSVPQWLGRIPTSGAIYSLAKNGSDLYVGGSFDSISDAVNTNGVNRTNLAKLSFLTGVVDTNWDASIVKAATAFPSLANSVQAVAASGNDLFVGGGFTNIAGAAREGLAKISLTSPAVIDTNWNPMAGTVSSIVALAPAPTSSFLYVAGAFDTLNGAEHFSNICRVATSGPSLPDPSFNPSPDGPCDAVLAIGNNIYVGGSFSQIGGASRYAFAFLPVADAPQLIQDTPTNLFLFPNEADGPEINYFQITNISGGTLYLSDGLTPVNAGDFLTVAQGSAGLKFAPGGTITAVAALNNTPSGAGTAATTLMMVTNPAPVFKFSAPTYSVVEGQQTYIVITVHKYGSGAASVNYATSDITAVGGVDYQPVNGTLNFSATDKAKNLIIAIAYDLQVEGDKQFAVTLTNGSAGASIAGPATAVVRIVEEVMVGAAGSLTTTVLPSAVPDSSGSLTVSLLPTNALGQWRLLGELNWHDSGASVAGLISGNYGIEFRPVHGYFQPQPVTVPISAGTNNAFTFFYTATTNLATGGLSVLLQPDDIATNTTLVLRGQWHRQGDSPTNWFDSGDIVPNLSAGSYTVEFKDVPGRISPASQLVQVGGGATYGIVATYLLGASTGAQTPVVVPFSTATTNAPYLYNGQIESSVGFSSGFVVQQRVVLTVAHGLFDDLLLSYVTEARWFFQRYRDQLEPPAQIPRGWYIFDGYAAQRQLDNSPGISTPASQDLDAAALFFLEDAGRGGYGGYLSDDAEANQYLLSANNKFLAGYPLDGVALADQGKLFATTPANLNFTLLYTSVFATTNIASYPGNSGGPLYVQSDVNQYLPAAIYLGGSGQTLVRAINSEVVDLINRAEISGNGGGNSTGGGVSILSPGITAPPFGEALLIINLSPSSATHVLPGWRIAQSGDTNYVTDAMTKVGLVAGGDYDLEFKPVPGFLAPSNRTVTAVLGQTITVNANYVPISLSVGFSYSNGLSLNGASGATYRVEYATNLTTQPIWMPLTTQTLVNPSLTVSNTRPAASGRRFYRAVLLP